MLRWVLIVEMAYSEIVQVLQLEEKVDIWPSWKSLYKTIEKPWSDLI